MNLALRSVVTKLEDDLRPNSSPVGFTSGHYFLPGIYVRSLTAAAGSKLVGKIHKKDHIMMILKGRIQVISERLVDEFAAGAIVECKAGDKRAAYFVEDTVWVTIHPSNETDLGKLEEELIAKDFEELE